MALVFGSGSKSLGAESDDGYKPSVFGLSPSASYEGTALSNLAGGRRTGRTFVGNLHLTLAAHADAFGLAGTSAFVDVLSIQGGKPSRWVGDAQGTSNIEGPVGTQLEEAWVQYDFGDGQASVLVGLYDLNSEFYALQASSLFLNGSFGIGPEFASSGVGGPSIFPSTSLGLRVAWKPTPDSAMRVALLDGVPAVRNAGARAAFQRSDGVLAVVEFAALSRIGGSAERLPGSAVGIDRFASLLPYGDKLAVGAWHYTGRFADQSDVSADGTPEQRRGSSGVYLVGERVLLGGHVSAGPHLSGFIQAGAADPRTNRFGTYLGAGLVGAGWGLRTDADQWGLAFAHATNGSHFQRATTASGPAPRAETVFELSYLTKFGKSLVIQPDIQYVVHPDTDRATPNAWVGQVRFRLDY